jgi:hypothetical protein
MCHHAVAARGSTRTNAPARWLSQAVVRTGWRPCGPRAVRTSRSWTARTTPTKVRVGVGYANRNQDEPRVEDRLARKRLLEANTLPSRLS